MNGESKPKNDASATESFAVLLYKDVIKTPEEKNNALILPKANKSTKFGLEVDSKDIQGFLGEQAVVLEELGREDERTQTLRDTRKNLGPLGAGDVEEHIGPVQFNMGGIQVDADDMLQRLKVILKALVTQIHILTTVGSPNSSDARSRNSRRYIGRW